MFKLGKEFHLLHVVSDLDTVDGWYDEVFAVRRFVRNTMKAAMRKASLVLIGDFVMEPAQPIRRAPGWEKSALGKFYTRYGQHFHSIAWYVDDLDETCARLSERKIRLVRHGRQCGHAALAQRRCGVDASAGYACGV